MPSPEAKVYFLAKFKQSVPTPALKVIPEKFLRNGKKARISNWASKNKKVYILSVVEIFFIILVLIFSLSRRLIRPRYDLTCDKTKFAFRIADLKSIAAI